MESVTRETEFLRALRCFALAGVVVMGTSACATPGASTDSYKLVLNAPGLENVQPKVDVIHEDYSQIIVRSAWNTSDSIWPQADLKFWRIKDNFRNLQIYVYESSLPDLVRSYLPGEWTAMGTDGKSKNVLGDVDYQRFRWKFDSECVFIRQGIDRFSDQTEVRGTGEPLGDMVIRGWYCVGPAEPNQDAAFRGFIQGIGIQGFALP